jgi:ABC-type nitrate/sulfonate/bicarbonate transport system substrate-binding protein
MIPSLLRRWCASAVLILAATAVAAQEREVTIGLGSGSLVAATARIAAELGLFREQRLQPKFTVLDNANAATTALIARSVQVAVSGPAELIIANTRGQKVVAIASAYSGLGGTVVLSKAAADRAGLTANAPAAARLKALDGLIIATPSPTATYKIAIDGAAKSAGATIRFTHMAMTAMPAALESGAVQGFIASAPIWGVPVLKGAAVPWISGPKGELPPAFAPKSSASMQVLKDFADANPDVVRALVAVYADFARAVRERPAEVKAAISKVYPDLTGEALDLAFTSESLAWGARPLTPDDIRHEITFVKSTGAPLPDVDALDPASLLVQ